MGTVEKKWEGKTGGGQFGQQFLLKFLKRVNVRFLYPILFLVIPFYILFDKKSRTASYQYFRKRQRFSVGKSMLSTFRNFITFGEVVLDKFALIAGNKEQFHIENFVSNSPIKQKIAEEKGFIIAGAHIGNLELSGICIPHTDKRINAIIFGGEREDFQKKRTQAFENSNINLIPVSNDMSHLFAIKEALEKGEIIVIPCDRVFGSPKSISLDFLSGKAKFPIGPFRLAAQLNVPIMTLHIMKKKNTHYEIFENEIDTHNELSNSTERAEAMARDYVKQLEVFVQKFPTQWFNFFPFWTDETNNNK